MRKLISIFQHPSNTDRTARLVSGPIYRERDIYSVRGGFVALMGRDYCFEGLFSTQADAETAQREYNANL